MTILSIELFPVKARKDSAYIFDLDDTLIKTASHIIVRDRYTGDFIRSQMSLTIDKETEEFDFSEFRKAHYLSNAELLPAFDKLYKLYEQQANIYILTARGHDSVDIIHDFLKNHLIKIPMFNIMTVNTTAPEEISRLKKERLDSLSKKYKHLHFIDDSKISLQTVKTIPNIKCYIPNIDSLLNL